jgi:hypothetical protein
MIWTGADTSAKNKLWDCANYCQIYCSLVQHSTTKWPSLCKPVKPDVSLPSLVVKARGQKSQHGRWCRWAEMHHVILWKEVIKLSDIHQSSEICWETAPACSTVFNWVWRFNSGKETTQVAVHKWYHNTPTESFHEATWKLPRRWQ